MSKSRSVKRQKELKAAQRRRQRRPTPAANLPVALKANGNLERRITRDRQDVLQNIEFTLVTGARDAEEVDDHLCEQALRLAIRRQDASENLVVQWLLGLLANMRLQRDDISDDLWRDALRVVYASLSRHSQCQPGETSYLSFVGRYIR